METEIRIAVHLKVAEGRGIGVAVLTRKKRHEISIFLVIMELLCLDLESHLAYSYVKSSSFTSKICALFFV